jgi:hypothetical protein
MFPLPGVPFSETHCVVKRHPLFSDGVGPFRLDRASLGNCSDSHAAPPHSAFWEIGFGPPSLAPPDPCRLASASPAPANSTVGGYAPG